MINFNSMSTVLGYFMLGNHIHLYFFVVSLVLFAHSLIK